MKKIYLITVIRTEQKDGSHYLNNTFNYIFTQRKLAEQAVKDMCEVLQGNGLTKKEVIKREGYNDHIELSDGKNICYCICLNPFSSFNSWGGMATCKELCTNHD